MTTHVVLLRAVNVGTSKRVPMAVFKALLHDVGCSAATTLLHSGNAVVTAPRTTSRSLARRVAVTLERRLGFEVPVVVKSCAELDDIVAGNRLAAAAEDPARLLVAFAQDDKAIASLRWIEGLVDQRERFLLRSCAAYLYCPHGILKSRAAGALLGKAGAAITTRNWATVLKLHALAR